MSGTRASVSLAAALAVVATLARSLAGCGAAPPDQRASQATTPTEPAPTETTTTEPITADPPPEEPAVACTQYVGPRVLGTVLDPRLAEISGLAASRAHPGVLYVHNDSGEPHARFFAIDVGGAVHAEYAVGAEPALDLEEIAIGPGRDGRDAIYLADIGDNDARNGRGARRSIHVLRVAEPEPSSAAPARSTLTPVDRFELRYPSTPVDCEAFFVDPATGDLYLLGKVASGLAPVFVAHAPLETSAPNVLERAGEMLAATDLGDSITASSLSFDGTRVAVRTYRHAFLFTRVGSEPWVDALAREPVMLPRLHEPQGEAISFLDASGMILSITEGAAAPIHALDPGCSVTPE